MNGIQPKYISDLLLCYEPSGQLRWPGTGLLTVPTAQIKH